MQKMYFMNADFAIPFSQFQVIKLSLKEYINKIIFNQDIISISVPVFSSKCRKMNF